MCTIEQAGIFARAYRKAYAEFKQEQQQQHKPKPPPQQPGGKGVAAAGAPTIPSAASLVGSTGAQPVLNWAGLQQLVAETARAGEQDGGKRAQTLKNAPALVADALAARGLPAVAEQQKQQEEEGGEGLLTGTGGTVERLRAAFNGAMARLGSSVEPGRLGAGVVEALGLLGQADVLLQELKGELGGGSGEGTAAGGTEGAADPAALARLWREFEGDGKDAAAAPSTPEPPAASVAGWLAGLGPAAREPVADAGALAAALRGLAGGRFQEGKGPYRLGSGGAMLLRATHTAPPLEGPGRTNWVAEVVLGKARGPEAAGGVVPVLVRVVVEGNPASAWSRRAEEAAAAALLRCGQWLRERDGGAADAVRTVAAVLEELRLTLRPGVCGITGRALMLDGASGPLELMTPYARTEAGGRRQGGGGGGRLVYPLVTGRLCE